MLPSCSALAAWESRLRPLLVRLPPAVSLRLYSRTRRWFLDRYVRERPHPRPVPESLAQTLWGVRFRAPLFNAAGMFKRGDGYEVVARQGAGAWLAGTTTATPRKGNRLHGVSLPFAPYPRSGAASNGLGLPNPGHAEVAKKLRSLQRVPGCPVGASLAFDTVDERGEKRGDKLSDEQKLDGLVTGLEHYADAGVDFVEINESCPNTEESTTGHSAEDEPGQLVARLAQIRDRFLDRHGASTPVIVKLSCDADPAEVPELVDALVRLGFAGANFGNTSTAYATLRTEIREAEQRLFDRFVERFGGGVSGRPLRPKSLHLVRLAANHLRAHSPQHEFHLVRTGGVETADDVRESNRAGAALSQWYTGYFEAFARQGHHLNRHLYEGLEA